VTWRRRRSAGGAANAFDAPMRSRARRAMIELRRRRHRFPYVHDISILLVARSVEDGERGGVARLDERSEEERAARHEPGLDLGEEAAGDAAAAKLGMDGEAVHPALLPPVDGAEDGADELARG
jgi:hypothetical protein